MSAEAFDRLLLLLIVQLGVIIAAARLLGLALRRGGQPQVIGEVIAGILLGPSFLGWIAPGLWGALFPPATLPFLKVLAEVGIVFFMFLIGLELNPLLLRNSGRAAVSISLTSIVVPFVLGAGAALGLYAQLANPEVSRIAFAGFVGAAMAITAFPVLARILIERDMLHSRIGALTLTCAAVDDITGWCLLALVAALGHGAGLGTPLVTIGWVLVYVGVMLVVVRPLIRRFTAFYATRGGVSQNMLSTAILLLLASALTTQWIGIHAIFGGFILGAMMPKESGFVRDVSEKIEDFTTVFFLPIYFAYTGLRTEITLVTGPAMWLACLLLIAIAVAGKLGGSAVAARWVGLSWREAGALGALVNTRGLMELIILNVGFDLGLITPPVFAMMVLMAVVTTMMTAPLLAWIDPHGTLQTSVVTPDPSGAGSSAVLVPVALSSSGAHLVEVAAAIAEWERPPIYALHVARPVERGALGARVPAEPLERDGALAPALAYGHAHGLDVRPLVVTSRQPADEICEMARVKGVRLIVMGWHKPVFARSVLGGTLDKVMRRCPLDLAILVDKGLPQTARRVLLPYSGTVHDQLALRFATRLARRKGADLTLLHIVHRAGTAPRLERDARQLLETVAPEPLTGHTVRLLVIETDRAVDMVLAEAGSHDLTVLGVGDEWQLGRQLFGLRSERVAVENPSSLLIVRAAG